MEREWSKLAAVPGGAAEGELIGEQVWSAMEVLREKGLSKKGIARALGLDVKTVRKWWRRPWRQQQRPARGHRLDRWRAFLQGRAAEVGFNAAVLHRELAEQGAVVSYRAVAHYISGWRGQWRAEPATVRFETSPGEQAQVDWGSTWVFFGEERVRIHIFTMVLGYSRRLFAKAYRSEGLDSLLDGHASAFGHFGGRTETILYDNPRTIVLSKDEAADTVVWNATFKDRMDFYGVRVRLCRYYRAQTKGKVESGVKYVKSNGLAGRRFRDLEELNSWLVTWCVEIADQRTHGTTHEKPAERFSRDEKLIAVDSRTPSPRERIESRRVPRDAYVAVDANRYPVPLEWAGSQVEVRIQAEEIWIGCSGSNALRHRRLSGKHQVARWDGPPRSCPAKAPAPPLGPPRFDPVYAETVGTVEVRPLWAYENLVEAVQP
jgi:transposase